jgi:hypothetical protein
MSSFASRPFGLTLLLFLLAACGVLVPPPVDTPPSVCEEGQQSTEEVPCTPRPDDGNGGGDEDGGGDGDSGEEPASCETTTVTPRYNARILSSQTTLKSCYAPGSSDTVFMSLKLEDSTITFIAPTLVFDIVTVDANGNTKSVAGTLLGNQAPGVNPDILRDDISKEQLLGGLEAAVSFKFSGSAAPGKYVMVLSLFMDADAHKQENLVGRTFYDFEIK